MLKPRALRIFSCVWGDSYINTFLKGTIKSLSWPKNKSSLNDATWTIVTKPEFSERLKHEVSQRFPKINVIIFEIPAQLTTPSGAIVDTIQFDHSNLILMTLIDEIKTCLEKNSRTLLCPPDTIFGEGSIANLLKMGEQDGTCVAVPHPRILPDILEDPYFKTGNSCTNEQLVKMTFEKYAHQSWRAAEIGCGVQNSLVGGVAWKKLESINGETLYAVQHRIPTVYLANWTAQDHDFFLNQPSFGSYDHTWPGQRLIRQERQRLVGSSDAVFIAEITEFDKNNPPWNIQMLKILEQQPDAFYRDDLHACINRQSVCIFRGR